MHEFKDLRASWRYPPIPSTAFHPDPPLHPLTDPKPALHPASTAQESMEVPEGNQSWEMHAPPKRDDPAGGMDAAADADQFSRQSSWGILAAPPGILGPGAPVVLVLGTYPSR